MTTAGAKPATVNHSAGNLGDLACGACDELPHEKGCQLRHRSPRQKARANAVCAALPTCVQVVLNSRGNWATLKKVFGSAEQAVLPPAILRQCRQLGKGKSAGWWQSEAARLRTRRAARAAANHSRSVRIFIPPFDNALHDRRGWTSAGLRQAHASITMRNGAGVCSNVTYVPGEVSYRGTSLNRFHGWLWLHSGRDCG